jgi:hypothetical protein
MLVVNLLSYVEFAGICFNSIGCFFALLTALLSRSFLVWWNPICLFVLELPVQKSLRIQQ